MATWKDSCGYGWVELNALDNECIIETLLPQEKMQLGIIFTRTVLKLWRCADGIYENCTEPNNTISALKTPITKARSPRLPPASKQHMPRFVNAVKSATHFEEAPHVRNPPAPLAFPPSRGLRLHSSFILPNSSEKQ
jgi:hypothetical protein